MSKTKIVDTPVLTEAARKAALQTKAGRSVTGEQIRARTEATGIAGKSPSVWGGVIQTLVRQGVLSPTGEKTRMTSPQARGRMSPVYTRESTRVSA